jgi:hypothetical protein
LAILAKLIVEPISPSASELARYLESRGDLSKPWMLQMLRLAKLKEARGSMSQEDYMSSIKEAHSDLMRLGQFWKGREAEVFGGSYKPNDVIEPLPGSPQDR